MRTETLEEDVINVNKTIRNLKNVILSGNMNRMDVAIISKRINSIIIHCDIMIELNKKNSIVGMRYIQARDQYEAFLVELYTRGCGQVNKNY